MLRHSEGSFPARSAQQLDGGDPASRVFGFGAILVLAGRAAHLEAVRRQAVMEVASK